MTAPHLPPKPENINLPTGNLSLPWVFVIIVIAALTSITLTLGTIVWLAPSFIPEYLVTSIVGRRADPNQALDTAVSTQVRLRTWTIRDNRQKIDDAFYRSDATKWSALSISSDGWLVASVPDYRIGQERYWDIVDPAGVSTTILQVVYDSQSNYTYIKTDRLGNPFLSFADKNILDSNEPVWVQTDGQWRPVEVLASQLAVPRNGYNIWHLRTKYVLDSNNPTSGVVITKDGAFVGITDSSGSIMPGWLVQNQYSTVLESSVIEYFGLPWRGVMVSGLLESEGANRKYQGFYVLSSPTRATSSTLGIGDVVLEIEENPIEERKLAQTVLFAPTKTKLIVLRDQEEIEVVVVKSVVK
jgi:hypothetical protein